MNAVIHQSGLIGDEAATLASSAAALASMTVSRIRYPSDGWKPTGGSYKVEVMIG